DRQGAYLFGAGAQERTEKGWLSNARQPRGGAQEVRAHEGAPQLPVLQAPSAGGKRAARAPCGDAADPRKKTAGDPSAQSFLPQRRLLTEGPLAQHKCWHGEIARHIGLLATPVSAPSAGAMRHGPLLSHSRAKSAVFLFPRSPSVS